MIKYRKEEKYVYRYACSSSFYEPINQDSELEELRHNTLDIHKNGTAPLEHIFNQMKCAGLDYLCLLPEDYRTQQGGKVLVSNEEISQLVNMAPDKFIGFAGLIRLQKMRLKNWRKHLKN